MLISGNILTFTSSCGPCLCLGISKSSVLRRERNWKHVNILKYKRYKRIEKVQGPHSVGQRKLSLERTVENRRPANSVGIRENCEIHEVCLYVLLNSWQCLLMLSPSNAHHPPRQSFHSPSFLTEKYPLGSVISSVLSNR